MRKRMIISAGVALFLQGMNGREASGQTPIPYVHVREADVMWSQRVWRVIDLREKMNLPLYYPTDELPNRIPLFRVIQKGLSEGKITKVFEFDIFTSEFGMQLTIPDARNKMTERIDVRDEEGNLLMDASGNQVTMQDTLRPERVAQYWIKEDWFFDKQRSVMDVRIIGLAPVIEIDDEATGRFSYKPLFWLYFPDCRDYFSKYKCYNPYNDADWRSFDDIFHKRFFSSYIRQESNVYSRPITAYAQGEEALFESERIKEEIFKFENDLWNY